MSEIRRSMVGVPPSVSIAHRSIFKANAPHREKKMPPPLLHTTTTTTNSSKDEEIAQKSNNSDSENDETLMENSNLNETTSQQTNTLAMNTTTTVVGATHPSSITDQGPPEKIRKKRRKRRLRLTENGPIKPKKGKIGEKKEKLFIEKKEVLEEEKDSEKEKREKEENEKKIFRRRRPPLYDYSPFQLLCDYLLRKLISKDPEEFFIHPVSETVAPDYMKIIEKPMEFSTMRRRIENNEYLNIGEFKHDIELIAENAMKYNGPNTVYYLAANKLLNIAKFYLSEQYLNYIRYSVPFGKNIPLECIDLMLTQKNSNNIEKDTTSTTTITKSKNNLDVLTAISDNIVSSDILKCSDKNIRNRLTSRLPNCKLAYLDNKNGAIALNILTGTENPRITLGDLIKPLEKGNPGICMAVEPKLCVDVPIAFTNPGPFSSFAPQYDSTWATLSKEDSKSLITCYGDRSNVSDAFSLRQMSTTTTTIDGNNGNVDNDGIMCYVDNFLDKLTDGEHSRCVRNIEKKPIRANNLIELLDNIKSLENLGLDLSFINQLKLDLGLKSTTTITTKNETEIIQNNNNNNEKLQKTGTMIHDLALLNYERLSCQPSLTITDAPPQPTHMENQLAEKIVNELNQQIIKMDVKPSDIVSKKAIHQSMGINGDDDDEDFDLLREFMIVEDL